MPRLDEYEWISSYEDAEEALGDRQKKKIGNNTVLIRRGNNIAVKLHDTDVVTFLGHGDIRLNTDGYRSSTTKDRLNRYTPSSIEIYQKDEWLVRVDTLDGEQVLEFEDGMVV